ncbi:MAG: TIGR03984 family CRISPR-associated protein [Synechococcaceae cyanobacterium SM2_3_2]|nr:TIGR03984 family CRISPR-associated protein [Synechococcaceae cyanobacterium SM2_3_2]
MSNPTTLYGRASNGIPLTTALEICAKHLSEAIGLLYAPDACHLVQFSDGNLRDSSGSPVDLAKVFEAKIFNETHELRWLNQNRGSGRAVILSEESLVDVLETKVENLEAIEVLPQKYLLWGKGVDSVDASQWGSIASARVGSLAVPIGEIQQDSYVYLHSREYLAEVDEFGNVAVVEERMIKLEVTK